VADLTVSITGGTGADVITLTNGAAITAMTIDGGAGTDSIPAIASFAGNTITFKDVESIIGTANTAGTAAYTITGTSATAISVGGADTVTSTNTTALTTVTQATTKTISLAGTGAFKVIGVTDAAITQTGSGALAVTSVDTQTITSSAVTTVDLTGVGTSKTLTVGGTGAFTVNNLGVGATGGVVTEATSGHTGALIVNTSSTVANSVTEVADATNSGAVTVNVVGTGLTTWKALTAHTSHTATMGAGTSLTVDANSDATAYTVTMTGANGHVYIGDTNTAAIDTITATNATGTTTISPNAGNDIVALGAATDTIKLAATLALNGKDSISAFTTGASGDVLNVNAFNSSATFAALTPITATAAATTSATNITQIVNINTAIAAKDYSNADFSQLFAASGTPFVTGATSGDKKVFIIQGTDQTQVYFATDANTTGTWEAADLSLVVVLTGVTNASTAWAAGNFSAA
jgi:hypothetical protein